MTARPAKPAPQPDAAISAGGAAIPRHVAIIMDGNGRWASKRRLPRVAGHRQGAEAVRKVVRAVGNLGIEVLTLYAFSSENWRRPADEIADLMNLMRRFVRSELDEIARAGVRIRVIGDYRAFEPDVVGLIDGAVARTVANLGPTLVVALNYGARAELAGVARNLAVEAAEGKIDPTRIDEAMIEARIETRDLPPLDLLIRTSGEQRLSNFMLWQAAYAELMFIDTLWPDFDGAALTAAIAEFGRRERRFGGV